jgi:hypothetical protein
LIKALSKGGENPVITSDRANNVNVSLTSKSKGKWHEILSKADAKQIWVELYRIVNSHPLIERARKVGLMFEHERCDIRLAQELFVTLLSKNRFQFFLDQKTSDSEIEAELTEIHLRNLITTELKKHYPESYRLARRIKTLIKTSNTLRKFDSPEQAEIYGLSEWPDEKKIRSYQEAKELVKTITSYNQKNGAKSEHIFDSAISNSELEELIVKVLKTIDSPMNICNLRSLVMSCLPVVDISPILIDEEDKEPAETLEKPLDDEKITRSIEDFLGNLDQKANGKSKRQNEIMKILWHCYLSDAKTTRQEIAEILGISESLISGYCHRIDNALRKLSFANTTEARKFEQKLKAKVLSVISKEKTKKKLKT